MWLDTRTAGPSVVPSSVLLRSGSGVVVAVRSVVVRSGRFLNGRLVVDKELSREDVVVAVVFGVVSEGTVVDVARVVATVVAVVVLDITVDVVDVVDVVVVVVVVVDVVVVDFVVAGVVELVKSFPPSL